MWHALPESVDIRHLSTFVTRNSRVYLTILEATRLIRDDVLVVELVELVEIFFKSSFI